MTDALAPSLDDIERLARAAWAAVPETFRTMAGDILFRVEDFASDDVLADLDIENPFELSGLYQGVDLTHPLDHGSDAATTDRFSVSARHPR